MTWTMHKHITNKQSHIHTHTNSIQLKLKHNVKPMILSICVSGVVLANTYYIRWLPDWIDCKWMSCVRLPGKTSLLFINAKGTTNRITIWLRPIASLFASLVQVYMCLCVLLVVVCCSYGKFWKMAKNSFFCISFAPLLMVKIIPIVKTITDRFPLQIR